MSYKPKENESKEKLLKEVEVNGVKRVPESIYITRM